MKKIFFLLTMFASIAASAQNMQITPLSATYTASPVIQFKVGWTGARTYRHNTKVWVFVDYRKIENNAPAGSWTRATVTVTPAVLSTPTTTTATLVSGNDKGFWLNGVDGDYSATLTVPLTLAGGVTQFNWCAYATDYPPNVVVHGNSSYTLRGSRPFVINGATLTANQTTYSGTITSFTDATGAPGLFPAALNEPPNEMGCLAGLIEHANGICVEPSVVGCTDEPLNLGTVSFTDGVEVEISGNGVYQIWSRPVTATGCNKEEYDGGSYPDSFRADCRNVPDYDTKLVSGCAAIIYASKICPYPWRIPTENDFKKLCNSQGNLETECPPNLCSTNKTFVDEFLYGYWGAEPTGYTNGGNNITYKNVYAAYLVMNHMELDPGSNPYYKNLYGDFMIRSDAVAADMGPTLLWIGCFWMNSAKAVRCIRDM